MNRVAKRKPRGDLRLWKEASEHAVHFEGTDPMPAIWPLSNERPGFGQWLPPKLPAFVPVRTFQWGEVARWAGGLRKRCSGWPRLHDPICHSAAASVAYTRRASPQCRTSCASFRLSFTIPGYNPGVPRRGPWGPRYTRTPGYRVRHGTLEASSRVSPRRSLRRSRRRGCQRGVERGTRRSETPYTRGMSGKHSLWGLSLTVFACAPLHTGLVADGREPRGDAPAVGSAPSSEDAGSVAPDPALNARWDSETPQVDDDAGIAWARGVLSSRCDRPQKLPESIESEQQFRHLFCKASNVDWRSYRIAVYAGREPTALRGLRVTQVKVTAERLIIFVEPAGSCGADVWGTDSPVAIVPRSTPPVTFIKRAPVGLPPCPAPDY